MTWPFLPSAGRIVARSGIPPVINPAPTAIQLSASTVSIAAVNNDVVGALTVTDPGETGVTYTVDDSRFKIMSTGALTANLARSNTGTLTAGIVTVNVTATDSAGGTRTEAKALTAFDPAAESLLFSRQMIGTGAPANTVYTFAQQFAQGTVPSGVPVVCKVDGAKIRTQFEPQKAWPDGSVMDALVAIEIPSLAANATKTLELWTGVHLSPGSNIDMATALSGRTASTTVTPTSGSPWTYDLVSNLPATRRRSGPLVASVVYHVPIPSGSFGGSTAGCLRAEMWVTKDGGLFCDWKIGNYWSVPMRDYGYGAVPEPAFGATLTLDGTQVLSESTTAMAGNTGSVVRLVGRKSGAAADANCIFLRPSVSEWNKAGICGRYDEASGVAASFLTTVQTRLADSAFQNAWTTNGTRNGLRNLRDGGITGDDESVYGIPFEAGSAAWCCGGHPDFFRYACARAEALSASQLWTFDKINGHWPNGDDLPGTRIFTGGDGFGIYNAHSFQCDMAHRVLGDELPALLTGRALLRDSVLNIAHLTSMDGINTYSGYRTWGEQGNQLRSFGYNLAIMAISRFFTNTLTPEVGSTTWIDRTTVANINYRMSSHASLQTAYGEIYGFYLHAGQFPPDVDNGASLVSPWQDSLVAISLSMLAIQGIPEALTALNWRRHYRWQGWLQSGSRWPLNMVASYARASPDGTFANAHKTWAAYIADNATYLAVQDASQKDTNYVGLWKHSLAMEAQVFPSDTTLQAAIAAFDAQNYAGRDLAYRQSQPKQNVLRPVGYAVPDPS